MRVDLINSHIGQRLRMKRREFGLSQTGLARNLDVTFQQVHKYETGKSLISAVRLNAIALALGSPVDYFFEGLPPEVDER